MLRIMTAAFCTVCTVCLTWKYRGVEERRTLQPVVGAGGAAVRGGAATSQQLASLRKNVFTVELVRT